MPCYSPLKGYIHPDVNPKTGRHKILFTPDNDCLPQPVSIPCGQCIGCRLERSRQWAIRCVHEASLYEDNCFITLTFDDDHLDPNESLNKRDFALFMKRLRRRFAPLIRVSCEPGKRKGYYKITKSWTPWGVRYYHCGEYGEKLDRPHHHACLFNFDFPDKKLWTIKNGNRLYTSNILNELWGFGFALIGEVTFESAAYVARYIMKKITNNKYNPDMKAAYYRGREPEFTTMSRRPGIGSDWLDKFSSDVYPDGMITIRRGVKCKVPRYYEKIFDLTDPEMLTKIKVDREIKAYVSPDNTPERLKIRGDIQLARAKQLTRGLECS